MGNFTCKGCGAPIQIQDGLECAFCHRPFIDSVDLDNDAEALQFGLGALRALKKAKGENPDNSNLQSKRSGNVIVIQNGKIIQSGPLANSQSQNYKECTNCGTQNRDDAVYCKNCGKEFQKICAQCQTVNRAIAKYCKNCGKQIES